MAMHCYDIIVAGDFRRSLCKITTIPDQLNALVSADYRVGILQLTSPLLDRSEGIDPSIRALIDQEQLAYLDPQQSLSARLLLATDSRLFPHTPRRLLRVGSDHRIVVVSQGSALSAYSPQTDLNIVMRNAENLLGGSVTWAPGTPTIRETLLGISPRPSLTDDDWGGCPDVEAWRQERQGLLGEKPSIGGAPSLFHDALQDRHELLSLFPEDPRFLVKLIDNDSRLIKVFGTIPRNWHLLSPEHVDEREFLASIDVFAHSGGLPGEGLLDPLLLKAMAGGVVPILPPAFEPLIGDGAVYAAPDQAAAAIMELCSSHELYADASRASVQCIAERFSSSTFIQRIEKAIGRPSQKLKGMAAQSSGTVTQAMRKPRRILFVTINGVGMGHLTRMLAIAKRCPEPIEPVFVTMSQALKVLRQQGYLAEFIPSRKYLDCDTTKWNSYLAEEISELISFYNPAVVVFDGNVPYQGFMEAIKANPDPFFVWSRRGMWRSESLDIIKRERFFDAVLEPGDLAGDDDHGITTRHRTRSHRVGPIRLLDRSDMLPRDEARRELGLSSDRLAALIQLGAGNNFDYQNIHKIAYNHLVEQYDAQVVLGEWLISDKPVDLPDTVVRMPDYPFARFFNAFDLAVSAVGYNSFHELLFAGVPTVLVPNEATEQDHQLARALYADRQGLAACVRAKDVYQLTPSIDRLMQPGERERVKANLSTIDPTNGADEAALFVSELAYSHRVDKP